MVLKKYHAIVRATNDATGTSQNTSGMFFIGLIMELLNCLRFSVNKWKQVLCCFRSAKKWKNDKRKKKEKEKEKLFREWAQASPFVFCLFCELYFPFLRFFPFVNMAVCHNAVSEQRANVPQMEAGTTAERGLQHTVGYVTQTQVATARQSP